ncbi:hypothetical protein RugamoR1_50050 [Rugamonas sp. R1(2021)]
MNMFITTTTFRRSVLALALSACATLASAASTFHIELDTAGFGSNGWIDLQFNPSPVDPVAAWADLSGFAGFGDSSTAQAVGVTGSLASGFRMSTAGGPSDLFHEVSFGGGKVSFNVTIDSDAGASQSGSAFSVALFNAAQDSVLGATGADGYSLLHLDWTPAANAGGSGSLVASGFNSASVHVSAVPEPTTWAMLGAGLALVGLARRRKLQA